MWCQAGVPWPRWRLPLPRASGKFPPRFGGSLLESKPGSLFESAEGPKWASTAVTVIAGIAQHAPTSPSDLTPGPGSQPAEPSSSAREIHARNQRGIDAILAALAPYPQAFNAVPDCLNQMFEVTPEGTRERQW